MPLYFKVDCLISHAGEEEILNAFFSSIIGNLEPKGRGTRFSEISLDIFDGELIWEKVEKAKSDLKIIREEMMKWSIYNIIWDIGNINEKAPEEFLLNMKNYNLLEVFKNRKNNLIIDVLDKKMESSIKFKENLKIAVEYI